MSHRPAGRALAFAVAATSLVVGCCNMAPAPTTVAAPEPAPRSAPDQTAPSGPAKPEPQLAAFSADLIGNNDAKSGARSAGAGRLVAVYDPATGVFRWKLAFSGLKGKPKTGQFHGAERAGGSVVSSLSFGRTIKSPMEGRANLSEAQAADLLSGKWYASIRSSSQTRDEIRGQLVLHE
ncbi:MAG: CHRD domain-containing protein [Rhodoferax sp.]|nr:CHRD domain-containing protein [Rhodoferax sp.]